MNRNDPQIPHREIDADEDELLDRLWEQTAGNESSHPARADMPNFRNGFTGGSACGESADSPVRAWPPW